MNYLISYEWKDKKENLDIPEEGTYYIAFGETGLHVFKNPTREKHFILILHGNTPFIIKEGAAKKIDPINGYTDNELKLTFLAKNTFLSKATRLLLDTRKKLNLSPKILGLGATAFLLMIFVLFQLFGGKENTVKKEIIKLDVAASDDQSKLQELIQMRYKLAAAAIEQKRFEKALEIVDKILKIDPKNQEALQLQASAKNQIETGKKESHEVLVQDIWVQQNLSEASNLMAAGDYVGAKFKLQQILNKEPNHAEALEMGRKIDDQLREAAETKSSQDEEKSIALTKSEVLFKEGKILAEEGKKLEAYKKLKEAVDLLNSFSMHPEFEVDLFDIFNVTKEYVENEAKNLLSVAEQNYTNGKNAGEVHEKSKWFKMAIEEIDKVGKTYEQLDTADLKNEILQDFNECLKPLYIEAVTLQELEGCCYAAPKLEEVKRLAYFPEVEYYNMSELAMNKCPCVR